MDLIEHYTPKNFLPSIKENYIRGYQNWWSLHKLVGKFLLFSLPVIIIEFIIIAVINHYTGMDFKR